MRIATRRQQVFRQSADFIFAPPFQTASAMVLRAGKETPTQNDSAPAWPGR
ncbi:hypothetical protein [Nitratidesulfovibrio termitidis]|uniref:hypothetical protein n=1 Tax=Nitratidesulfovibrio termitidis TaxID=42252 RepID=UPI0003F8FD46|nr:hypothetical protein [Nitratidesulfovibrio termitidis]